MTERKPPGMSFESWVDKQIREAVERGEFDNLPGTGKPIRDLDTPYDEVWVRRKLRQEGVSTEDLLPTPLKLRKEIERLPETVRDLRSEQAVRDVVATLNGRILQWLRTPGDGPRVLVGPVNVDSVVERWRADREAATRRTTATSPAHQAPVEAPTRRVPWWRRLARRDSR